jgi:hypothetical protein
MQFLKKIIKLTIAYLVKLRFTKSKDSSGSESIVQQGSLCVAANVKDFSE